METFVINETHLIFHTEFLNEKYIIKIENGLKSTMSDHYGFYIIYTRNHEYVCSGAFSKNGRFGVDYGLLNSWIKNFGFKLDL